MKPMFCKAGLAIVLLLSQGGCSLLPELSHLPTRTKTKPQVTAPSYAEVTAAVRKIASEELFVPADQIDLKVALMQQKHPQYNEPLTDELGVDAIVILVEQRFEIEIYNEEIELTPSKEYLDSHKTLSLQRLINIVWRKTRG